MYKVSQEVKNLFNKNYIQVADITVNGVNESFSVAENEIVQGSLSIDRYSVSNSKIEVGSAVAAELTLKLKNDDGKYDNTVFEGAEVFVKIGIKKWDAHRWENAVIHWIPCGYFTIDEPPRALSTITISALDRMILFDKTVDISKLSFPMTVADLLNKICTICGVTLATDITRLPNKDYQITAYPEGQDLTYRTLLQWCAALTGTCAFMNYDGNLELKWYEQTDLTISPSERYNSDMQENDVTITGIYFKDAANTEYIAGTDDYCLDLSSNGLLQDNVQVVLDTLYVSLKGFSYRPYTATIKSAPYIYPMDMIHYEDAKGEVHDTIITNVTFGMNLSTSIAGKGETTQKQKYSQSGGLTKQQATILEKLRENLDKAMTAKEQAQLELNRLLSNSLGLNIVTIPQDDGTQVYYFCDGETLESSNIIYTFKANGFAWTKSWNEGNPVWKYGFSKDGNAIYNMLAAYKISTEYLDAECVTAEKLSAEYKQSVTTEMEETVDEKLTDYSTTEETKTLIANTGGTIRTEVAESVKTVTDTTNAKIDDRLAQAKDYTDSVHQEITTEYSTKLEETSKGFNMSVNSLTDRITEQGNEVNSYREQLQTYFGFSEDGLEIGKKVNGEKQQYSINIDNERMGFLQDGSEVAFIQYNKLHINAVEAMDRLSVGAAADGGYFDFISTEYGMGVKWRAVEKTDNASIVSVMKIPRRASRYVPVVDEDNIFQMEGVNEE
nr:MAG: late control gene D protein [Bacteriophage sp.]